jgi:hypothetical protein|tara:strand:- start:92 stop:625 length:534 start_codon:yes stop_codon:yes gene_type:complete
MSILAFDNLLSLGFVCVLALAGFGMPLSAQAIQANAEMIASCHELVLDYATYRDQENAEKFAALFTAGGSLSVMDQTFVGHKAIAARLANKDGPTLRHMMTNIRITPVDATSATGVSYALIYGGAKSTGPSMVANFTAMGEYFDEYSYADEGCRFTQRKFVATFLPSVPASPTNISK